MPNASGQPIGSETKLQAAGQSQSDAEPEGAGRTQTPRRQRTHLSAPHVAIGFPLIPLVKRRCSGGDQSRADERVNDRPNGPGSGVPEVVADSGAHHDEPRNTGFG